MSLDELPPGAEWADPPRHGAGNTPLWAARLQPLRLSPGRWASFGDQHRNSVTEINHGIKSGIKPGEFEAVSRKGVLYVRYVGDAP